MPPQESKKEEKGMENMKTVQNVEQDKGVNTVKKTIQSVVQKLTSRKFICAMIGIIIGIGMVFGLDQTTIQSVAGAVVSLWSVVTYIITERRIDAASVAQAAADIQSAIDLITDDGDAADKGDGNTDNANN